MKLLKFVNSDAPPTFAGASITGNSITFHSGPGHHNAAKAWTVTPVAKPALQGGYWLLDDDNKPICVLNDVQLATPDPTVPTVSSTPRGVTDGDVASLDLRSKLGRQLERVRAEYGSTYKTAAKSARLLMNAAEVSEKKNERLKREREEVADAIEAGEDLEVKKKSKSRAKKEKSA